MPPLGEPAGLVLAGGRSRRLGTDKRFLELGGEPLWQRATRILAAVADPVHLVLATPDDPLAQNLAGDPAWHGRLQFDREPGNGPLAALLDATEMLAAPAWLVLAVDLIGIDAAFLRAFLAYARARGAAIAVPGDADGQLHAGLLYLTAEGHQRLRAACAPGERRFQVVLRTAAAHVVPEQTWRAWNPEALANVNTPAEAAAAGLLKPERTHPC